MERPKATNATLWKKLTPKQQREWVSLYRKFVNELNLLSKIHNEVKAHNLAYEAVWSMK